jgi:hypothetical protein
MVKSDDMWSSSITALVTAVEVVAVALLLRKENAMPLLILEAVLVRTGI